MDQYLHSVNKALNSRGSSRLHISKTTWRHITCCVFIWRLISYWKCYDHEWSYQNVLAVWSIQYGFYRRGIRCEENAWDLIKWDSKGKGGKEYWIDSWHTWKARITKHTQLTHKILQRLKTKIHSCVAFWNFNLETISVSLNRLLDLNSMSLIVNWLGSLIPNSSPQFIWRNGFA